MLSLDYPQVLKHDMDYYVSGQLSYSTNTSSTTMATSNIMTSLPYWNTTDSNMDIWHHTGYEQGLLPLLPQQQQNDDHSMRSDASSIVQSPCFVTSSPSISTFSSISPSPQQHHPLDTSSTSSPPPFTSTLMTDNNEITPIITLQQWSREALIDRVLTLEQELVYYHSSESPKQDGWQCRWDSCDTVTSTLEQLTDHLHRVHVGRGKATYYCGWTGCARHDKPFTKRHKMHNHLRTHTGERPFVCRTAGCQKRFSRPDSLSTHQKTHSNVRPFVCADCGKSYFHARSLRKHLKASHHHGFSNNLIG
ncbi:uncharacterized protein BX664DRAFT_322913 [Halteromyces radiatus]|uniref:uncharacterized protein n=1 Tax=Halteromyces radiatus TaxID=101107 RepID=UPI00221FFC9B|nr:uncharacterized protein BX664DRAFT_322913 [Halteromyces radiatus]KAI8100117.1 hypothetical protein BX664DRAFT_322913 [Halteromyces radiatus]